VIARLRVFHESILAVLERAEALPPLLARVSVGLVFVTTGYGKLQNLERVTAFFDSLGIPAPGFHAPFVATTEIFCGLLLVLGFATRFASVPLIVTMIVAIRTALWAELEGVIDLLGRQEFLFIVLLSWLSVAGAGVISVDAGIARWLRAGRSGRAGDALLVPTPGRGALRS
jgi:putative oxidoreductase